MAQTKKQVSLDDLLVLAAQGVKKKWRKQVMSLKEIVSLIDPGKWLEAKKGVLINCGKDFFATVDQKYPDLIALGRNSSNTQRYKKKS